MKNYNYFILLLFFTLFQFKTYSQVGIGTTDPHSSSILEMKSTTQGLLTPRMTTLQRNTIASPAEGLMVFDTEEDAFYFHDGTSWLALEGAIKRDNYKLVKSAADLADELTAGGGTEYLLNTGFLYEINGTITLTAPINLNNAYISGEDTNEDILVRAIGDIFTGSKGGSIRGLTLMATAGNVFNLSAIGPENLIFRDCVVLSSSSVGSISDFGLVFSSIIQYVNNGGGITYTDINELLLNNQGWAGSNSGTYEKFVGTFDLIEKISGFSTIASGATGIDVSANPTVSEGVLLSTVFSGAGTPVLGYSVGTYPGYNFNINWNVNCPGLKLETDNNATGDINLSASIGSGSETNFSGTGTSSRKKLVGSTSSNNLFRFTKTGNNRIDYNGKKTRYFSINTSLSFQGDNKKTIFIFYIAKNGTVIEQTRVYRENGANEDVGAAAIVGTIELAPSDYIEVWVERYSGDGGLLMVSLNLTAR